MHDDLLVTLTAIEKIQVGKNVWIRVMYESDKHAEVAVVIKDGTTIDQVRAAWPSVCAIRKQLLSVQGSDPNDALTAIRLDRYLMHRKGFSYAEIAMEVNYDCLVHLCAVYLAIDHDDLDEASKRLSYLDLNLQAVRLKNRDLDAWVGKALDDIDAGNAPWTLDKGLVDKEQIRAANRQLDRDQARGKFRILHAPRTRDVNWENVRKVNDPPESLADKLLSRAPDSGGLKRYLDAIARVNATGAEETG